MRLTHMARLADAAAVRHGQPHAVIGSDHISPYNLYFLIPAREIERGDVVCYRTGANPSPKEEGTHA